MNTSFEVSVGLYKLVFNREHNGNSKYLDNLPHDRLIYNALFIMAPKIDKRVLRDIYFPSCLICTTNQCKYLEL